MIGLYHGISPISRAISFFTWAAETHASEVHEDRSVTEAWHVGGVRRTGHFCLDHAPGTRIDLYRVKGLTPGEQDGVDEFLGWQIGKAYDYRGVLRFLSRRDPREIVDHRHTRRWFCSVLIFCAYLHVRRPLLDRVSPHKVSPALLSYSPHLIHIDTLTTWSMSHETAKVIYDRPHPPRHCFAQ